jgi:hypothetical protein
MRRSATLWSFSPLSKWTPRDSRCRQELAGAAPLGAVGGCLAGGGGGAGRGAGRGWRVLRMVQALARRRRYKRRT